MMLAECSGTWLSIAAVVIVLVGCVFGFILERWTNRRW